MKNILPVLLFVLGFIGCGGSDDEPEIVVDITCSPTEVSAGYEKTSLPLYVTCDREWMVYSNDTWITCEKNTSGTGNEGDVTISITANTSTSQREGTIIVKSGSTRVSIPVTQDGKPETPTDPNIIVPVGYKLVWQDEFNDPRQTNGKPVLPNTDLWWYETGNNGWGNNEIQNYVPAVKGTDTCAMVYDGTLKIVAKKVGSEVLSTRMNTSTNWTYGYFEARLKLPVGKGTWPAFWMMPKNFTAWPKDGEIDIMEEVGYRPNYISSSIHCQAYYHSIGTQKTAEKYVTTSQSEFHVYAVEWTEDFIKGYVDGVNYFTFANDKKGDYNTWPFSNPFYLKLNLAWGGNWGGAQGVDESFLPATYEVDYVRVFQKN
jgi:hypothetical protein